MADNTEHDNIDDSVVVVEKQVKLEVTSVCSEGREESDAGLKFLREIQIMEMERVTEFPMSNVDIGPRKRQRIGWDVVHPVAKSEAGKKLPFILIVNLQGIHQVQPY
ncbi:putative dual-specificity kinase [Helianthus annuus]|uniref:Uncharacterized protein n=1 Tax=Helianthus annuus TaxID=4232 RepID=A0A251SKB5_HELAN|nr:uncharacterized protein LOC110904166 isoform X1 [Helianthus annuus]XP_035839239.1 uncharacterized protein LOC110904166 isoform X1 [Helianthus annuus]XP_035839240.1 uncharacterized protein LOC110904166 isoform X1 [Helianthus annuus]KAJ0465045.1 putative dual-specificity kinase [Helianthus annuus]KAJ0486638.1 putative dual-specificity kinase [Helianthus annuus]KAJ0657210.1 putative dual-specificity kinase [Helianthus annuus]KAJ0660775.1 putative dual-specificity kinase [Helianthus annuus]KA